MCVYTDAIVLRILGRLVIVNVVDISRGRPPYGFCLCSMRNVIKANACFYPHPLLFSLLYLFARQHIFASLLMAVSLSLYTLLDFEPRHGKDNIADGWTHFYNVYIPLFYAQLRAVCTEKP